MAEVTGRIGENDVELDNAATESTLRLLLLATAGSTKEMKRIIQMAEKAGLNEKIVQQANEDVENLGIAAAQGSRSMRTLRGGAMLVGAVMGDIAAGLVKTTGALVGLTGQFLNGTAAVSDVFDAFKDLPLGLGLIARAFKQIAEFQQQGLEGYRQLTSSGINLAGGLNEVRQQAADVGLTFQEYGEVIRQNSQIIAQMGLGMENANRAFRDINNSLTVGGVNNQLLNMGYSFRQINELTAGYVQVNAGLTTSQRRNNSLVTNSVIEYGKQLDALSRLTGKQREEIAKELEQATQDAMWQDYLLSLDEKARENANAAIINAGIQGGKGAQDAIKAMFMGLPPLTEASRIYTATMTQGTAALEEQVRIALNGRTVAENQLAIDRQMARAIKGNITDLEQFRTVLQAGGFTGDALAQEMIKIQEAVALFRKNGMNEENALLNAIQEARKRQNDQINDQVKAAIESEKAMKRVSVAVMAALLPAIEKLSKPVTNLAIRFANLIADNIGSLETALTSLADYLENLFTEEGRQKVMNDLRKFLSDLFSDIWDIIKPWGESREERDERYKVQNSSEYKAWLSSTAQSTNTALQEIIKAGNQKQIYDAYNKFNNSLEARQALANRPLVNMAENRVSRATGSLGSTGKLFENFGNGSLLEAHGYESILTPGQLVDLLRTERSETAKEIAPIMAEPNENEGRMQRASIEQGKSLVTELQTLNKQTADMIRYLRETSDYTRKNLDAIRGLNGNLFAA
jgi:hypothetical protein